MRYTQEELDDAAYLDLIADAESAERRAKEGPFDPERGSTPEAWQKYAEKCREMAKNRQGLHRRILNGE